MGKSWGDGLPWQPCANILFCLVSWVDRIKLHIKVPCLFCSLPLMHEWVWPHRFDGILSVFRHPCCWFPYCESSTSINHHPFRRSQRLGERWWEYSKYIQSIPTKSGWQRMYCSGPAWVQGRCEKMACGIVSSAKHSRWMTVRNLTIAQWIGELRLHPCLDIMYIV